MRDGRIHNENTDVLLRDDSQFLVKYFPQLVFESGGAMHESGVQLPPRCLRLLRRAARPIGEGTLVLSRPKNTSNPDLLLTCMARPLLKASSRLVEATVPLISLNPDRSLALSQKCFQLREPPKSFL
ncbi:hypothetical protein TNCV_681121 [Trichonephila clavipes]|nr:hypothetical protein TNCV_681121 [Trichonephila clavipes]